MRLKTPLLSNLSVLENITLIKEVHERLSYDEAKIPAYEALERVGYRHINQLRSAQCNEKERFIAQLIRASMMQYAKIVVITPFVLLSDAEEIGFLLDCFEKLGIGGRCMVLDMQANRAKYEEGGSACSIVT